MTFSNTLGTAVALDVEYLRFSYDLNDGAGNPSDVRFLPIDYTNAGACSPSPCFPTQIRKVTMTVTARAANPGTRRSRCSETRSRHRYRCAAWRWSTTISRSRMRMTKQERVDRARARDDAGIALITALLAVLLLSGVMAGMFAVIRIESARAGLRPGPDAGLRRGARGTRKADRRSRLALRR